MVVNRAALPITPAKYQRLIGRTLMHQIAAISLRRKLRKFLDVGKVQAQPFQAVSEHIDRDAFVVLIQLGEPLFKRDFHKKTNA